MKAILFGKDQSINWTEVETPEPKPGELRIKIEATAVNRADLMQRAGLYPPPPGASDIPGLECVGLVDIVGEGVTGFEIGDRVCALLSAGGYAEYVTCPADHCLPVPQEISNPLDFAGLPEVLATAWLNIFIETQIKAGERVLIHAGASGVGTAAIQLCHAFNHPCAVTVGTQEKLDRCLALGANNGAVRQEENFIDSVKTWTEGKGFDVILCPIGGGYLQDNIKALNTDGRLVIIGLMGGRSADLDIGRLLVKRIRVIGSTLRSRSQADKSRLLSDLRDNVWPLVLENRIKPIIDHRFPINDLDKAYNLISSNQTFGKVLMTIN
ncbi:MAG: NAD(P)H-quinone oxidoreductase [Pseudomonadales bacterium]|nr:NAD(P)H-quinone oxidoreductase [Pseudomonadales bacterium]